jgi:hypothetical protein
MPKKDVFIDKKKLPTIVHSMQHLKVGRPVSNTSALPISTNKLPALVLVNAYG